MAVATALALTVAVGLSVFRVQSQPDRGLRPPPDPAVLVGSAAAAAQLTSQPKAAASAESAMVAGQHKVAAHPGPPSPEKAQKSRLAAAPPKPASTRLHRTDAGSDASVRAAPPPAATARLPQIYRAKAPEATGDVSRELTDADTPNGRWGI